MELTVTNVKILQAETKKYYHKSRVSIFPEGETLLENLQNRRSRPFKAYRKLVEQTLDSLGADRSKLDIKWSQKAGCSCGCSPGFIIDGFVEKLHRKNLYLTVTQQ